MSNNTATAMPNVTMAQNALSMADIQKQMEAMKKEMARMTAVDVKGVLDLAIKDKANSEAYELPTPNGHYLTAKMASAMFMSLRDELTGAYMKAESIQTDKKIILERIEQNSFRSDVERAAAERSLSYYESLDERLEEVISLISDVYHVYDTAVKAQHDDDDRRQCDVPSAERIYTAIPSIRWVSSADKTANPTGWEDANDTARIMQQAEFWLTYNS